MDQRTNDLEIGKLIAGVKTLNEKMLAMNVMLETMHKELESIKNKYATGKGALFGIAIAAIALGGVAGNIAEKLFTALLK